jgi:hypothetical protein
MEKEPHDIQEIDEEDSFLFTEDDLESTHTLFAQAQGLHTNISKLLKKLDPYLFILPPYAKEAVQCFKIFSDSLGLYKLALIEYKTFISLDDKNKEFNDLCALHESTVALIENCWDEKHLKNLWGEFKNFYASNDFDSAKSFISFFNEANITLDPFLTKIKIITDSIIQHKKDILTIPPNLLKLLSRLSLYCSIIPKLLRRRMPEYEKIESYLTHGFIPNVSAQLEAITLANTNRINLRSYFGSLRDFKLVALGELIEHAPLGSWCTEMHEQKIELVSFFNQELLSPLLRNIREEEVLRSIFSRCGVKQVFILNNLAAEIQVTRARNQKRALLCIGSTPFIIQNKNVYTSLTENNLNLLVEDLDRFLNNGESFIKVEELLFLKTDTSHAFQENLKKYMAESDWYCNIVISNFDFISTIADALVQTDIVQIDRSTAIKMKRMCLLLELTIDHLNKNTTLKDHPAKKNFSLFEEYLIDLQEVLKKPEIVSLFDTRLELK